MKITYGCDCVYGCHPGSAATVPCAFLIERNGLLMKVCTRCDLTRDIYVARLFDAETNTVPFFEYDALGAHIIAGIISEEEWTEFKQRGSWL